MVFLGKLILALIIGVILIVGSRPKPDIVIKIENGKPKVKRGRVSRLFLQDCERICSDFNIQKGRITGKKSPALFRLSSQAVLKKNIISSSAMLGISTDKLYSQ